jgi:hypothetical protein
MNSGLCKITPLSTNGGNKDRNLSTASRGKTIDK